MFFSLNKI